MAAVSHFSTRSSPVGTRRHQPRCAGHSSVCPRHFPSDISGGGREEGRGRGTRSARANRALGFTVAFLPVRVVESEGITHTQAGLHKINATSASARHLREPLTLVGNSALSTCYQRVHSLNVKPLSKHPFPAPHRPVRAELRHQRRRTGCFPARRHRRRQAQTGRARRLSGISPCRCGRRHPGHRYSRKSPFLGRCWRRNSRCHICCSSIARACAICSARP